MIPSVMHPKAFDYGLPIETRSHAPPAGWWAIPDKNLVGGEVSTHFDNPMVVNQPQPFATIEISWT